MITSTNLGLGKCVYLVALDFLFAYFRLICLGMVFLDMLLFVRTCSNGLVSLRRILYSLLITHFKQWHLLRQTQKGDRGGAGVKGNY